MDELWGVIGVDHRMYLWKLWEALPTMLPDVKVSRMDVSIAICGICGDSTLSNIMGQIPVLGDWLLGLGGV